MVENLNFTNQEKIDDLKFKSPNATEQQVSVLFDNTLITILVSSVVIFLFFRMFCNYIYNYQLIFLVGKKKKKNVKVEGKQKRREEVMLMCPCSTGPNGGRRTNTHTSSSEFLSWFTLIGKLRPRPVSWVYFFEYAQYWHEACQVIIFWHILTKSAPS